MVGPRGGFVPCVRAKVRAKDRRRRRAGKLRILRRSKLTCDGERKEKLDREEA